VVLTSDNPRSETPAAILREIEAGVATIPDASARTRVIEDRGGAIEEAIAWARAGDAIVIAGKGHETTQVFADRTVPFDDRRVASACLADLGYDGGPHAGA